MSELTNVHARSVKDLTTPTNLPANPNALDQVKLVAGNFPSGFQAEALTVDQLIEVFKRVIQTPVNNLADVAYPTLAEALTHIGDLPSGKLVLITNDGENNGLYLSDGATLNKTEYDGIVLSDIFKDIKTITDVVKLDETTDVTSQYGDVFYTLKKALYEVIQTGGFEPFLTEEALLASVPTVPKKAAKALDTHKIWYWDGSSWIDMGLSEIDQANQNIIQTSASFYNSGFDLYDPNINYVYSIVNGSVKVLSVENNNLYGDFYTKDGEKIVGNGVKSFTDLYSPNENAEDLNVNDGEYLKLVLKDNSNALNVTTDLYKPEDDDKTVLKDGDEVLATFPLDENQGVSSSSPAQSYFYKDGSLIKYVDELGEHTANVARTIDAVMPYSSKACLATSINEWFSNGKSLNVLGANGCLYPDAKKVLVIVPSYGQSLDVGSQGVPPISLDNPQPEYSLMLNGVNVRLDSSGTLGKTPLTDFSKVTDFEPILVKNNTSNASDDLSKEMLCIPFAQKISDILSKENDAPIRVFSFAAGVGGTPLDMTDFPESDQTGIGLKKGSNAYANLLGAITKAKELAESKGWIVVVPHIIWQHGEGDANNPNYGLRVNTLVSDLNADIKTITGQTQNVYFHALLKANHNTTATIGLEQTLQVAATNPLFKIVGSTYPAQPALWANDFTHRSARGYNYMGYMYAKALYQEMRTGFGTFKGLTFKSAVKTGTQIDVEFNVPVAPIKYKTTDVVLAHASWGFRFTDNNVEITISNVQILNATTVRLTLASTPSSATQVLSAAMYGHIGSNPQLSTIPRSNLCDSDTGFGNSAGGDSTENWLIPFKYTF